MSDTTPKDQPPIEVQARRGARRKKPGNVIQFPPDCWLQHPSSEQQLAELSALTEMLIERLRAMNERFGHCTCSEEPSE